MLTSELSTMARVNMLVAERDELAGSLKQALEKSWSAPSGPQGNKINVDALVQAFCVSLQTAPKGEPPEKSARKAVEFYLYCVERGLITPEGQGEGNESAAA